MLMQVRFGERALGQPAPVGGSHAYAGEIWGASARSVSTRGRSRGSYSAFLRAFTEWGNMHTWLGILGEDMVVICVCVCGGGKG